MVVALKLSRKDLNSNQRNHLSFYPKRVNHCGSKEEEESEEEISFDKRQYRRRIRALPNAGESNGKEESEEEITSDFVGGFEAPHIVFIPFSGF